MHPLDHSVLASALAAAVLVPLCAVAAAAADSPGLAAYLDGLDALEQSRWNDAVGAFSKAIDAEEENADYYTARGVAYALAEKPDQALGDLQRADRLRPNFKPTRLWLATVVAMQGRFTEDVNYYPAATRDPYESAVRAMSRKYGELAFRAANMPGQSDPKWQAERSEALSNSPRSPGSLSNGPSRPAHRSAGR